MAPISSSNAPKVGTNRLVQLLGPWSTHDGPLYQQLAAEITTLIASGSLRAGEQLPPERTLASALSVSRGTIVRAFDQLASDGAVERLRGSGTIVAGRPVTTGTRSDDFIGERLWATEGAAVDLLKAIPIMLPEVADLVSSIDLTPHAADLDGAEPLGWWRLRESIAALHTRQGLPTSPHQVLVTSGAQQAISLVAGAMAHPGEVVLGEEDTWPGLIDAVQHIGARFEPVQLDRDGLVVDDLEAKIDRFRPSLMAFNPQHQNPTGSRLPPERVAAVAALARRYRIPTLEDRVAADLGFDRRHLPAIDEHDTGGYGLIAGSICKVAWPGLRLGWLRADAQVINRLRSHKAVADMFTPAISQALGLAVVERYDELTGRRLDQLRPAADLVLATLREQLDDWSYAPLRGGLSVWASLPEHTSATAFVQHANRHGVLIASGRQFGAIDADCPNIRIPFTAPYPQLAEGLQRLSHAWRTFDRQPVAATVV
ncbi:aminotransferase-like domain-containing protein [Ilumatobacter nonamiensis]|uniref:aminotransferase-like domain-containing protein n=1 Tax=Ilumatobacter nonamiensis TaxID=467093 RepID=UPI0003494195|nr:PLP-dependent aminotransferase family protein [Ilumatobacter nonamiensis]